MDGFSDRGSIPLASTNFRTISCKMCIRDSLFDNCIGSELCGFYEIFNVDKKKEMIEKSFQTRLEGFLYHGDYDYDANDERDMLNDRKPVDALLEEIERYHLYQQQTQGGVYYILSGGYDVIR